PPGAGHGHAPVEGDRHLVRDERPPARDPNAPGLVLHASLPELGDLDLPPRRAQSLEAAPVHFRVRVADRGHHAGDACLHDRVRARGRRPVVRAGLEGDVQRRPPRMLTGRRERGDLRVRGASARVPALADHFAVAYQHGADQRVCRLDRPASPFRELERALQAHRPRPRGPARRPVISDGRAGNPPDLRTAPQASPHASACTNRRYARGRSSRPKIAVAATNSSAPASRSSAMLVGPTPPSTCTCIERGTSERSFATRSSDSGMNAWPEYPGWTLMQRARSTSASRAACAASSTSVSGLNASPTCSPCSRASATTSGRFGQVSKWTVTLSAPASANPGMCRSGLSTIRWQSSTPPSRWTS